MIRTSMDRLRQENAALRERLEEVEATLHAVRAGEVDALFLDTERDQVLTLETPEKPYRLLVEQMANAAATLTDEGAIIYANRRFADLLSRPLSELIGKPLETVVRPESRTVLETLLRDGRAAEAHAEITLQRDDGTCVTVYLGVRTLREGALGSCLVVTDVTTQRHYDELRRATEALKIADRRKDEFVATLAHELRNPLAPIRNAVQVLRAKALHHPELQWSRDVIDRQVRVMARLLEDLLDVSRISLQKLELRKERIEWAAVLEGALETSRPVIEASRHKLTLTPPTQPILIEADPLRLAQVFSNLLNNAAKYTEDGGDIWLTAETQGSELIVSVRDSGIGIAGEMLPHLFEMFSQAKPALVRSQGGLGIGLALVKGLVELHGGSIEARSAGSGQGSEFVVRLPIACGAADVEPARQAYRATNPAEARWRILIVDDNRDGTDTLTALLEMMGHEVRSAYDGAQALDIAEMLHPDVVLLDLGMPGVDGYETCRRIRERPWSKGTLFVALTGWGSELDRARTKAQGFDHHLVKPVDPDVLMSLLGARASK